MKDKIRNVILVMIAFHLIVACCSEPTYEITITGLDSRALIQDGINFIEFDKQDPIDKEDLIIEVLTNEVEEIVSSEYYNKSNTKIKVLEAAIVPCADQVLVFTNRIESLKVEILDSDNNNARIDITDQMVIQGTQQTISEYILENNPGIRNFFIEFSDTSNIPDRITYVVEATLDDGREISSSEGIITFN